MTDDIPKDVRDAIRRGDDSPHPPGSCSRCDAKRDARRVDRFGPWHTATERPTVRAAMAHEASLSEDEPEPSIAAIAEKLVAGDRRDAYGSPAEAHERIAALWSVVFGVDVSATQVAQALIALKLARTLGPGRKRDNWADLIGYAIIADELEADGGAS